MSMLARRQGTRGGSARERGPTTASRELNWEGVKGATLSRGRTGLDRVAVIALPSFRLVVVVTATLSALVLRAVVVQPFSVPSAAMTPTLQSGDRIVVVKSSTIAGPIHRGDIVVFRRPSHFPCRATQSGNGDLVQRVIAVPGQTIWSAGKKIFLNGHALSERGWYDAKYGQVGATAIKRTTVPAGRYFVMGDNRSDSCDSRVFGTIARTSIVGKVFAIVARAGHPYVRLF